MLCRFLYDVHKTHTLLCFHLIDCLVLIICLSVCCIDPQGRSASVPAMDAGSTTQRPQRAALDLCLSDPRISSTAV